MVSVFFQHADLYILTPKYEYEITIKLYPAKYLIPLAE